MTDLRTSIIVDLLGNVHAQSRRFGRDLENMAARGSRGVRVLNRGLGLMGRGLDRLGNRYTAFLFGAGGVGTLRMVGNLEERFTLLGIQANTTSKEIAKLKQEIFETAQAAQIRVDPSQLTAAVEEIVEKTGDLAFARANLQNLGAAIRATGAEGTAIGGIAAEFQKMGLTKPADVLKALDILDVQGKQGAFTLQNLAALGPRVVTAYTAMGRTGLPAIREMGAALQTIRQGTGSSEMAATAFEALMRTLGDAEKVKLLRRGGIKVFDQEALKNGQQILRPINELMVEIVKRAKGRKTVLSNIFDAEAIRAFNAAASEFQRNGTVASLDKYYNVQADGTTVLRDSARASKDFNAALTNISTTYKKFASKELTGPIGFLADKINSLSPDAADRWMQVAKWIGIAGGGAILGRKLFAGKGGKSIAGKLPGMGDGVVPVYVTNPGFGGGTVPGTVAKGRGGILPILGRGGAAAAAMYGLHELSLEPLGMGLTGFKKHWSGYSEAYSRLLEVLSGKRDFHSGALTNGAGGQQTMYGKMDISIDNQNRLRVTHLESRNMDIDVDTGRTMVMPR